MSEIPKKTTDDGYLVYPRERLISDLNPSRKGRRLLTQSQKTALLYTSWDEVENSTQQKENTGSRTDNRKTSEVPKNDGYLVYPRERLISDLNPQRKGKRILTQSQKTALLYTSWEEVESSNPFQNKETPDSKGNRARGTGEAKTPKARKSRRLSDYRDSQEIQELIRERKESQARRLSEQKERRENATTTTPEQQQKERDEQHQRRRSSRSARRLSDYREESDFQRYLKEKQERRVNAERQRAIAAEEEEERERQRQQQQQQQREKKNKNKEEEESRDDNNNKNSSSRKNSKNNEGLRKFFGRRSSIAKAKGGGGTRGDRSAGQGEAVAASPQQEEGKAPKDDQ